MALRLDIRQDHEGGSKYGYNMVAVVGDTDENFDPPRLHETIIGAADRSAYEAKADRPGVVMQAGGTRYELRPALPTAQARIFGHCLAELLRTYGSDPIVTMNGTELPEVGLVGAEQG
jgi:hypothetical protein